MYLFLCFFFNDTATTEIYTLSLHDALPIFLRARVAELAAQHLVALEVARRVEQVRREQLDAAGVELGRRQLVEVLVVVRAGVRSEEHTSELQSRQYLVCRLLLEKKKKLSI